MIVKLILLLVVLYLLWKGIYKYRRLPATQRRGALAKLLMLGLFAVVVLGVITGRMHWLGVVFAGLLPLLRFGSTTLLRLLPFWLRRTGGVASFKTEHLDVKVHIQQAHITGHVIKGTFEGRAVEELTDDELKQLEADYKDRDTKSHYIVRMIRKRGQRGNFEQSSASPPPFSQPERDEALQILGLKGQPDRDTIIAAHRRLIQKLHPDRGGSDFLAARVNQAKDILLRDIENA